MITEQGVPYYRPAEPKIPETNNVPAQLIMQGTRNILEAAIERRKAELAHEKMIQDGEIAAQNLELQKQQLAQDYDLKKTYYSYLSSKAGEVDDRRKAALDNQLAEAEARQNWYDTIDDNDARATQALADLKLNDATRMTDDPVSYYADAKQFINRFKGAVVGKAPELVRDLQTKLDQMKVPYVEGSTTVEPHYEPDPNDPNKLKFVSGFTGAGRSTQVPVGQLYERFASSNPAGREAIVRGLMAAGNTEISSKFQKIAGKDVPSTDYRLDPALATQLQKAAKTDFNAGKNEVPEVLKRKRTQREINDSAVMPPVGDSTGGVGRPATQSEAAQQADEAIRSSRAQPTLTPPDLPPTSSAVPASPSFEPTATDKLISQAKAILNVNPGARDEVLRRLVARGINPNALDEVAA